MEPTDAVSVVRRQHRELWRLLDDLCAQPQVSERILGGQLRARQQLTLSLGRSFVSQEAAKRRHLWPVVQSAWPDGRAIVDEALDQRLEIEQTLVKMRWFGDRDPEVNDVVDDLVEALRRHLAFEERVLARLSHTPPPRDLDEVGRKLTRRAWARPVRPHPDLPDARLPAALATPMLALLDRVIEACAFKPTGS